MAVPRVQLPAWLTRAPVVSLGLAAVWLVLCLVVQLGFVAQRRTVEAEIDRAVRFVLDNPAVAIHSRLLPAVRSMMPGFESNEMFAFLRNASSEGDGPSLQERSDVLAAAAFADLDAYPHRRLGVIPADLSPHGFATHVLVHSTWLHALSTLLLWLLVAPLLEELWGRRVFAGAVLLLGLAGAGVFTLMHPGSDRALVGASSVLAGLVAALVVRFRSQEIDALGWLSAFVNAEFRTPVWLLAALWVVYEASLWWTAQGALPGGVDNAVGYAAHAGGLLLGAVLPLAVGYMGWEERFGRVSVGVGSAPAVERFDFQKVLKARAAGKTEEAFAMLRGEVERSARNRDAVTTFWEMCIERGEPERAGAAVLRLVREELRRGAEEVAVAQWRELAEHLPTSHLDPVTLLRLVPMIQRIDGDEHVVLALQQCMNGPDDSLTPVQAAQVARLAVELDPQLALEAARRSLGAEGLDEAAQAEMKQLVRRFGADDASERDLDVEETGGGPDRELEPSVFYQESDRSDFGEVADLSQLNDFPRGVLSEAVPRSLGDAGVRVVVAGAEQEVAYGRVRAVSAVGAHGLGPRPVVLIDLLVDGGGTERPLSVVRFRSDQYDPRPLAPQAGSPLEALAALVRTILERSGARPLPDAASVTCSPPRVYASLEEYHEQVLRPLADELG